MSHQLSNLRRRLGEAKDGVAEASGELDRLPEETAEAVREDFVQAISKIREWIRDAERAANGNADDDEMIRLSSFGEELIHDLKMLRMSTS